MVADAPTSSCLSNRYRPTLFVRERKRSELSVIHLRRQRTVDFERNNDLVRRAAAIIVECIIHRNKGREREKRLTNWKNEQMNECARARDACWIPFLPSLYYNTTTFHFSGIFLVSYRTVHVILTVNYKLSTFFNSLSEKIGEYPLSRAVRWIRSAFVWISLKDALQTARITFSFSRQSPVKRGFPRWCIRQRIYTVILRDVSAPISD